jgi:probable addiction module antidote protein
MNIPLHRSHEEATIESLRKDPQFAAAYLTTILEDGDQQELLTALRYLAKAFGSAAQLAEQVELNAITLYRTFSPRGNPEIKSLHALLKAMRLRFVVQPLDEESLHETHPV